MRHKSGKTDQSSFGLRAAAIKPFIKNLLNDILKLEYFTIFSAWVMRNYFAGNHYKVASKISAL